MSRLNAIIRCPDDGAARDKCRVLRKNSNDDTAQPACGEVFIAETASPAAHFSGATQRADLLILK
jgi:hypothetical protein